MRIALAVLTALCVVGTPMQSLAQTDCTKGGVLDFLQKDTAEYASIAFAFCVHQNQCTPALDNLEKLKKLDPVRHAYLYGAALANGVCGIPQNLNLAEENLLLCAQYSHVCKCALFDLYVQQGVIKSDYENYALVLAETGASSAMDYLYMLYASSGESFNLGKALFWLTIRYDGIQRAVNSQPNNYVLIELHYLLSKEIQKISLQLHPQAFETIQGLALSHVPLIKTPDPNDDPLTAIGGLYAPYDVPRKAGALTKPLGTLRPSSFLAPSKSLQEKMDIVCWVLSQGSPHGNLICQSPEMCYKFS